MMKQIAVYFFSLSIILTSCKENRDLEILKAEPEVKILPEYAKGFGISDYGEYKTVSVFNPYQGARDTLTWYLVPRGSDLQYQFEGHHVIQTPVTKMVCTSTTHIPLLDYLDVEYSLTGFPNLDYISSPSIRERIDQGEVTDLGAQIDLNLELLVSLQPDMVMGYSMTGDLSQFGKIEQSGIPVILNSEYLEPHPLGRAEWIKFLAVFFDKYDMADSIFNKIKSNYLEISAKVSDVGSRPKVLSGVVYGDTWFLPGGDNYGSKIINDAGGDYLWKEDKSTGYLELSFESVYDKALDADFWIGVASYNSLEQLASGDSRYANFKPFRQGRVYSYNKRIGPTGGNEYLELGYLRPDLILKDLATIFHPEKVEENELFFYEQLK